MEREWLTVEEAAQYLGVERINLYRLIHKQGLPACRMPGGRRYRVARSAIDQWMQSGRVSTVPRRLFKDGQDEPGATPPDPAA